MIAEIISTGNEIMTGAIVDTNSSFIAQNLREWGCPVSRKTSVGDSREDLKVIFLEVARRANICIVTGGLGPTTDDITTEVAAQVAGVELEENPEARKSLESFFENRGRSVQDEDVKQARLPKGAQCLPNPMGTAPGFTILLEKCHFFFLPGVPVEMKGMLQEEVRPRLQSLGVDAQGGKEVRLLTLFGIREAQASKALYEFMKEFPELELGYRATFPQIQLRIYHDPSQKEQVEKAFQWILHRVGRWVCSREGRYLSKEVGEILKERGASLALAESCTGGFISSLLTDASGSSEYFLFSGVTYSNECKMRVLGVSEETLIAHGAVSEEVAGEMAQGARKVAGATYGLSTSGVAGPTGGTEEKPVGTICVGVATPEEVKTYRYVLNFHNRKRNKELFAALALDLLRRAILGEKPAF